MTTCCLQWSSRQNGHRGQIFWNYSSWIKVCIVPDIKLPALIDLRNHKFSKVHKYKVSRWIYCIPRNLQSRACILWSGGSIHDNGWKMESFAPTNIYSNIGAYSCPILRVKCWPDAVINIQRESSESVTTKTKYYVSISKLLKYPSFH